MGQNQSKTKSFECCVGETIHLKCLNFGNSAQWMLNGKKILGDGNDYIKLGAEYDDAGKYECKIDGKVECVYHVNVYRYLFESDFLGIRMSVSDSHTLTGNAKSTKNPTFEKNSKVVKPSKNEGDCKLTVFSMKRNPRGIAVIIGIEQFDNLQDLCGIKKDIENCTTTFTQLHFNVMVCKSSKAEDILTYLGTIANTNHSYYDCFILYVSSHGGHGYVCCSDFLGSNTDKNAIKKNASGYINIDTLIEMFMSKKCKTLRNKPKLFFFDCCRNLDSELSEKTCGSPIRTFKDDLKIAKHYSDIFIGYATISGTSASIDTNGSHYTNVLMKCMRELAPTNSFGDVMTQVATTMRKTYNRISHHESTLCGQIKMKNLLWKPNQEI